MAKANIKARLQKLLTNELSSTSSDKKQVSSAYTTLIDILKIPQINKQLHGCHELLFACISQIYLTPSHQFFDDNQLRSLLESASNARVLSMSQNQSIDDWLQNIEERVFEGPDNDDDDEDDDDLYEDATDSEPEEVVEVEEIIIKEETNKKPNRDRDNQRQKKVSFSLDSPPVSSKEKSPPVAQPATNQRNGHVAHSRGQRGGHQNTERKEIKETSAREKDNRRARGNSKTTSENNRGKNARALPFDNKYGVDLRLYDCYICGEYGHVQYDCPKKQGQSKVSSRGGSKKQKPKKRSKSSSSSSSEDTPLNKPDENKLQQVYNQLAKLLNSSQNTHERNETFKLFLSSVSKVQKQHGENLPKIFLEKENIFYSLVCHIAQHEFLFTDEQYSKIYEIRAIILPQKQSLLDEDRSLFSRQRTLIALQSIREHIKKVSQIQQTIFNDFQEYVIRSIAPISPVLYDLIKFLLKSSIHIDPKCFEYFTNKILFDSKKTIFSNEQIEELQSSLAIRIKRSQRNQQKQIWKERLNLFRNDQLTADLNQWIDEFDEILKFDDNEQKESSTIVVENAIWYFAVLIMSSSGHLNKDQYERLLNAAIHSTLFNSIQKFYFQVYLKQGHAPITMNELKDIKKKLENENHSEKQSAYELLVNIFDRSKPEFHQETNSSSPVVTDSTKTDNQSNKIDDIIPIIDNHIIARLLSLVETICSDTETFSTEQCTILVNKFLHHSSIVRPLVQVDQNRLNSFLSRPISLTDLKTYCSSLNSDLNDFLFLLQNRIQTTNDAILDYLIETIVNIFQNRTKYSDDKCRELKDLIEKKVYGKKRLQLINQSYEKYRSTKKNLSSVNRTILNQFLTNILSHDYQTHLDFFTLLEDLCQSMDFNEKTIEFEINRCLLSTIILVITEVDFPNLSNPDFFRHRLQTLMNKQTDFFLSLLSEQQFALIVSRLTISSNLDPFLNSLKTNFNEKTFENLLEFIRNDLKENEDFDKLINFILFTFDQECLSIERTIQLINLIIHHPKLTQKTFPNLLQFLLDLLQFRIHSSPKLFLKLIETHQDNQQIHEQIFFILKNSHGNSATAEWKKVMIQIITILFHQNNQHEQLKTIAQQSPMFQMNIFKQQLETCWNNPSDDNHQSSTVLKEHSAAHREMFRCLESDDKSINTLVAQQFQAYLLDEQLPSEILLAKFIQALQVIFKSPQKFSQISLDQWAILVENNRGKIFPTDSQCDQLLLNIIFTRLNMSTMTLNSLQRLIQSKKAHERYDGLQKLLLLLKNTQLSNKNNEQHLPTISNQLYTIITEVIFNEKFKNDQVRQCLTDAKHSYLLNNEYREKLDQI